MLIRQPPLGNENVVVIMGWLSNKDITELLIHLGHKKVVVLKAGFHWRQSRSQSRKSASELVKIENRSCKWSHKFNGIGVGRIRFHL